MKVIITNAAYADLEQIGDHIALDNPKRAGSLIAELLETAQTLSKSPARHPLVPRYESQGVRRMPHGNFAIFYRVESEMVVIVHIQHGARDCEAILFPDE